ncbi:hypothetical protein [Jiella pelagia]|uniref:Uncharacterized protein n=1 Tax=Jiella pelagia TaxID=2986949 RepID=A0ABY7BYI8_9HYPH|nr:hypothetical protein [Jiella pelagia]WAP68190.1 hypothetical protein OH818_22905 [Jiella pelagia]
MTFATGSVIGRRLNEAAEPEPHEGHPSHEHAGPFPRECGDGMGQLPDVTSADASGCLLQAARDLAHEMRRHRLVALAKLVGRLADGGGEIVEVRGDRLLGLVGTLIGPFFCVIGKRLSIGFDVLARMFAFSTGRIGLTFEPALCPLVCWVRPGIAGCLGDVGHDLSPYANPTSDKIASTTTIRPMR